MKMKKYENMLRLISEAIDRDLYFPLKAELEKADIVHSLGYRKEKLKKNIEDIVNDEMRL